MNTRRRVLVTGGSGFIGSHLVGALIARGDDVLSLDLSKPKIGAHEPFWRKMDLMERSALAAAVAGFEPNVIFNLAANADISNSGAVLAVNTDGLQNLIDSACQSNHPAQLVHASTQLVVRPGYEPRSERDFAPYTEYGDTKARSEELLWHSPDQLRWTIVRPTTVWGAWHPSFAQSIWKYLGRRWYLLPTGVDPIRSYGYVGNVVHQLLAVSEKAADIVDRRIFYVGDEPVRSSVWLDGFSRALTGRPVRRVPGSLLRLAAMLGEASGRAGGPSPINLGRLYRMTTDYPTPMGRTFDVLGRGPYSFDEGVRSSLAWLRSRT